MRFAIEGKSYALLVLLVALAWWWRRAQRPWLVRKACAGLTHFYGLFVVLATAIWDALQRRRQWALAAGSQRCPPWLGSLRL